MNVMSWSVNYLSNIPPPPPEIIQNKNHRHRGNHERADARKAAIVQYARENGDINAMQISDFLGIGLKAAKTYLYELSVCGAMARVKKGNLVTYSITKK